MGLELFFLPLPEVGHLISAVELAKRLIERHDFTVTVLILHFPSPTTETVITSYTQSVAASNPSINFVDLPTVDMQSEDNESFISIFIELHKAHVKEAIVTRSSSSPSTCVAALIVDFFATTMIDVGKELSIPTYVHFTSGAALLGLMLYLPTLHVKIPCEFRELEGEVEVPGMAPLPPLAMPSPVMEKTDDGYGWFLYHARRFRETNGLIVNSFAELEPGPFKAISNGQCLPDHHPTPPVYPVGPLFAIKERPHQPQTSQLMEWLDQQPNSSVVFLCFGSMGTFPTPQLKDMALALERSGHRFLWSVQSSAEGKLDKILPDGFLDRTQGRGLVWPSWVPQVAILAHVAIGGFVSHCGWNSCLESIWFGVPILAWPLYAEQRLNAFQMVRDYGLAVELRVVYKGDGLVSGEELERGVRCLMGDSEEGQKVRKRAKEMRDVSRKAVKEEGSSFSHLGLLTKQLIEGVATGR